MNLDLIPDHMHDAVIRYVEDGIEPGGFLEAVLCNDLKGAVMRADAINKARLFNWVEFVVWELPASCQGSVEKYQNWIAMGGLNGIERKERRGL